jgi:DeoR family transcriptional regulator, fructose operon transcriptional repressor
MSYQTSKPYILAQLKENGHVSNLDLAQALNVSERTVVRYLVELEKESHLVKTWGGAMLPSLAEEVTLTSFKSKNTKNTSFKQYIARIASGQINQGDVIFMDSSSTVFELCPYLAEKKVKVITNALPVALQLSNTSAQVLLLGGELDHERQATFGTVTLKQAMQTRARKAFVGSDGISLKYGPSNLTEKSAELSRIFLEQAEKKYLLADHSKFNKDSYASFGAVTDLTSIFSDQKLDFETYKEYQKTVDIIK